MKNTKVNSVQTKAELETFYTADDPWEYDGNPDDTARKARLLALLPQREFFRTVDIGCGNGFVTVELPGENVVGVDISERAIRFAEQRAEKRPDANRFAFRAASLFELPEVLEPDSVDLFVITGVLYPQYVGAAFSTVRLIIDKLLKPGGFIASCHIDDWSNWRFPYNLVDQSIYPYREFDHRLEILLK